MLLENTSHKCRTVTEAPRGCAQGLRIEDVPGQV